MTRKSRRNMMKVSNRDRYLKQGIGALLVAGTCFNGIAEAETVVDIDKPVSMGVYGNSTGVNHAVRPVVSEANDYTLNLNSNAKVFSASAALVNDGDYDTLGVANNNILNVNNATINVGHGTINTTTPPIGMHWDIGVAAASMYGNSKATGNKLTINGIDGNGSFIQSYGAHILGEGSASGNEIVVNDGAIADAFGAEIAVCGSNTGTVQVSVTDNRAIINGGEITQSVNGGAVSPAPGLLVNELSVSRADIHVDNNNVILANNSKSENVFGGLALEILPGTASMGGTANIISYNSSVNNNYVEIRDNAEASRVFGGYAVSVKDGTASNNIVIVNGGKIYETVEASQIMAQGLSGTIRSNNNEIIINDGKINGDVIVNSVVALNDDVVIEMNNNKVSWTGGTIDGIINGSLIMKGMENPSYEMGDSSFNFYASDTNSNKTIMGISNFKNYNFYLDNTVSPNSTLITVQTPVDLTKSNVGVAMTSDNKLEIGDSITLLATPELKTSPDLKNDTNNMDLDHGRTRRMIGENIYDVFDFDLENDGFNLKATLGNKSENPKFESISASRQPLINLLDDHVDVVDMAYEFSLDHDEPVGFYDFNYAKVKADGVDMQGNSMVFGSAFTKGERDTITQGPFLEYGDSSFTGHKLYGSGLVDDSGKVKKYGAGYLYRKVIDKRHHLDAYVRAGRISHDYSSNIEHIGSLGYEDESMYYAAHLGYGQFFQIDPYTKLDVYGKYFYKNIAGSDSTAYINGYDAINTEFDSLTSHKLRLGSKLTVKRDKKRTWYADLAIEHELSKTQKSYMGGRSISNESRSDTTGVLEVGYKQVFGPNDALVFTADVCGYVGSRSGFGGSIGISFNF